MDDKKPRKGGGAPRHDKDSGLVQYKDGQWGIDIFLHGKRQRRKVGTKPQARKVRDDLKAAERLGAVELPGKTKKKTLGSFIESYLRTTNTERDQVDPNDAEAAQKRKWSSTNIGFAKQWLASHGRLFPEQFTLEMLRDWCHDRLRAGAEVSSIRRAMDPLRAVYGDVARAGAISLEQNPFRDPKALRLPARNKRAAKDYLPLSKRAELEASFGPFWWPYAVFAIATLMRFENQRSLRWDNIDWVGRVANLVKTKNGHSFQVQLSDLTIILLQKQLERQRDSGKLSEWCWPNSRGGQLDKDHFRERIWGPAFERCGLKKLGKGRNGLTWHAMGRHTGATWLMQAGEDIFTIMGVMNHEDVQTTMIYSHHSDNAGRQAMEVLASILMGASNDPKDRGSNAAVNASKDAKKDTKPKSENPYGIGFSPN